MAQARGTWKPQIAVRLPVRSSFFRYPSHRQNRLPYTVKEIVAEPLTNGQTRFGERDR